MSITKMTVRGSRQTIAPAMSEDPLMAKETFIVAGSNRAVAESFEINLKQDDVVEMVFDDNSSWFCNADTIEDLFPEASTTNRSSNVSFILPNELSPTEDNRGMVGDVLLKLVNVFSKKKLGSQIRSLAADLEKKQLQNLTGLYQVNKQFDLTPLVWKNGNQPWLLFLHGTASSTQGSFAELIGSPAWNFMQEHYGERIIAFQHETLTKSPLQNVEDLLSLVPGDAIFHLVTHSRGGLVGDVLARFCNGSALNKGFDNNEIALLQKEQRDADIKNIEAINNIIIKRKIKIEKFIRVACPASGTTLASGRLDNFFNMSFNLLGIGTGMVASPVFISFRALIAGVINCKNDVDTLPGLEAMNPDSPFLKVLNNLSSKVILDNPLTIISGNCKTKLSFKSLLIIAARIFYQKDNDLVVNTAAMHKGAQRLSRVQYYLDVDSDVDHFHYFKNPDTQQALLAALKTSNDEPVPGFQVLLSNDAVLDRNALLKLEGGQVHPEPVSGSRPIVVVLPGIMGSNLSANDKLVWINYLRFLAGELQKLDIKSSGIEAPSVVRSSYAKLVNYLSSTYDVVVFPFDWRKQLNESAKLLAVKLEELMIHGQPIKLIGHSMGGVLVRDMMVSQPSTWKKINESIGFRLIFLGSPLGGSFRIPFVLFGKDAIIDKISKLDIFHSKRELLSIFGKFPGLLSLLPYSRDANNDFGLNTTWQQMCDALGEEGWPLPGNADLATFSKYRDAVLNSMNYSFYNNAVYVAGKDKSTPCGYRIDKTANGKQLVFLSTGEGDQSVTWDSGIPKKMIENDAVYYVNVSHGALANEPAMFRGIEELLATGNTSQGMYSKSRPVVRGVEKLFKSPVADDHDLSPQSLENTILGIGEPLVDSRPQLELSVTVVNGDLRFASYPLLAGHFKNDGITSAEWQINKNLDYALSDRHKLGIYPGEIGTSELFINDKSDFKGALIVGLGSLHKFTAYELTQTVQQGVSKYLLDVQKSGTVGKLGISSLLVGSGYGGLSIENTIRAIIQGIQNANAKISGLGEAGFNLIEHIEFIELYEDNSLHCFYSLKRVATENDKDLRLSVKENIETVLGKRRRIIMRNDDTWWNRISVRRTENGNDNIRQQFVFAASTGAARDLERTIYVNPALLKEILDEISTNNSWNRELAKTIFELLVPNDFKEQLKRRSNSSWVLDEHTAAYPWELLQDRISESRPLCVNAGMIRQLSERETAFHINTVSTNNALVVGDPFLDGFVTQLPGAYAEAELVSGIFTGQEFNTIISLKEKSSQIIGKLFSFDYKIMHLAGHGLFNGEKPEESGMLIGNNVFLTTAEIAQMSAVPEFVFVNCCFLGKTDGQAENLYRQRYRLAANIGTQLIKNGVRAVVVAGWAVDDTAALEFAKLFYTNMFGGDTFGDAVRKARRHCYDKFGERNNTWGAYQCYGDPFYQFDTRHSSKADKQPYVIAEEAEIDLENLRNALEIGVEDDEKLSAWLQSISHDIDKAGIRNAAITELEAYIHTELQQYEQALQKFDALLLMENASFFVATLETFCNCKAKNSIAAFKSQKIKSAASMSAINKVIKELENLLYISPTAERFNLLGSTYKLKSLLSNTASIKVKAIEAAAWHYQAAFEKPGTLNTYYPLTNWYILESILVAMGVRKWGSNIIFGKEKYFLKTKVEVISQIEAAIKNLEKSGRSFNNFEKQVALLNLNLSKMITDPSGSNEEDWKKISNDFRTVLKGIASNSRKKVEIEQIEILIETLKLSKSKEAVNTRKGLEKVLEAIQKLLK